MAAEKVAVELTREEYLHLAKILQLINSGVQLYIEGFHANRTITKEISRKMFMSFMNAEDKSREQDKV